MAVRRAVIAAIMGQFGPPGGAAGRVAGWVMAHRRSNRQRNSWVVSLLEVQPTENVLEIGFGPGLAIAELSRRAGEQGHVYGIDHSDVMLRQATRRNAAAIVAGRVTLRRASVDQLPPALGGRFDAILAVNSLGLWPAQLAEPRCPGATASTSRAAARKIEALLQGAGYTKTRTQTLGLNPPVVCVLAVNPDPDRGRSPPASDPTS